MFLQLFLELLERTILMTYSSEEDSVHYNVLMPATEE
jgi:hypothetical protein